MHNSTFNIASFCKSLPLLVLAVLSVGVSTANAQVFDSGPSDPALFGTVINLPPDPDIVDSESIGGDGFTTQLNVDDDGFVGRFFEALNGSEVNISGGTVGNNFSALDGSEVNISGGTVRFGFEVSGSEVNISGGIVIAGFEANDGSEVNISGGTVGRSSAFDGSVVNISGGTVGNFFANSGSEVNISGGTVGNFFEAKAGSDVELIGGEFQLNNANFTGSTITLSSDDVFTGTLADGSTFIFSTLGNSGSITDVTLTSVELPVLDSSPIVVDTINPVRPSGLRSGQSLTLQAGGELGDNFETVNATLNIEGGTLGFGARAAYSVVNISGGSVGQVFTANGSEVSISGGTVAGGFEANDGSEVSISGGTVGDVDASDGSEVNISGGSVDGCTRASSDSVVNISGGVICILQVGDSAVVNLSGSDFVLDGELLDDLVPGEAFAIADRDVTLSGKYADGSAFSFLLLNSPVNSLPFCGDAYFAPEATLTVNLVAPFLLGDVDQDGSVSLFDIAPFISLLQTRGFMDEADIDRNGEVNLFDIAPFINLLVSQ